MKNTFKSLRLTLAALAAVALLGTSCQKEIATDASREPEMLRNGAPQKGTESIAAIAVNAGFSELVSALAYVDEKEGTSLVKLFSEGTDQYTVFAPTNQAFQNLYAAASQVLNTPVTKISDLPSDLVLNVLLYHVTGGRRAANSVVPPNGSRTIETLLSGATFSVSSMGMITAVGNSANISAANISASNGIIHVIDAVILPIQL